MRSYLPISAALLCLLTAMPAIAEDAVTGSMPSEIRIEPQEPGLFRITTTNRFYQTNILASVAEYGIINHQLLEIEQSTEKVEGVEAETATEAADITVRAYPLTDQGKGAQSFEIKMAGDAFAADGPFLTVTQYGCCAEQATHAVFSLETGSYLFNATGNGRSGDWVTMGARGGFDKERIIAAHVALTTMDEEVLAGHANAVAAITYARRDKPLQRVLLLAPQADIEGEAALNWMAIPSLISAKAPEGTDHIFIEREGDSAELFTGIAYRLALDEAHVIDIPITADKLDIKAAKLPEGYRLIDAAINQPY